ncbi:hypothetical protein ZIOFF_037357 [Zingiber officinale]|uniref:Uncharacterized protein n=1 Tax=Zingiber officinale TaxID=94328 RepID=A0A8J5GJG2_ZINOF|nr:hypothetical protein ZIOFF_037357 [Zingiber officinale]
MSPRLVTSIEIEAVNADEDIRDTQRLNTLWPLDQVDPKKAKFPCCIVWTPLPIVSWLAPFIGHVGIGREDGNVLDFAGSNFVNVDNFAYGAVARYLQLDREQLPNNMYHASNMFTYWLTYAYGAASMMLSSQPRRRFLLLSHHFHEYPCFSQCDLLKITNYQVGDTMPMQVISKHSAFIMLFHDFSVLRLIQCCFPPNLSAHTCKQPYRHAELGTAISWDDTLQSNMQHFQHKYYNLFTCNCHVFVAACLNQLAYRGSVHWNMLNVAALILWKGQWVDGMSVFRSFSPFTAVLFVGILVAGWPFLIGMAAFSSLLIGWFIVWTYCIKISD